MSATITVRDERIIKVLDALRQSGVKYRIESMYSNGSLPYVAIILSDYTINGREIETRSREDVPVMALD